MKSPRNLGRGSGGNGDAQGELFEPPPFSPIFPTPSTLEGRALAMLLRQMRIEHPDFERATGSWRLGAYVEMLRRKGWPILTDDITSPIPERPDRVIARYRMPDWVIRVLGGAA